MLILRLKRDSEADTDSDTETDSEVVILIWKSTPTQTLKPTPKLRLIDSNTEVLNDADFLADSLKDTDADSECDWLTDFEADSRVD